MLEIYSGENHISHGICESAYFYRGFPGFSRNIRWCTDFLVYHNRVILVRLGWRNADNGRIENVDIAYLRSRSPNGNGNMLTAKLHPDRSDVDKN